MIVVFSLLQWMVYIINTTVNVLSIIKFIEREREFRSSNRDQIYLYFSPLIEKEKPNGNTLSEFLQ